LTTTKNLVGKVKHANINIVLKYRNTCMPNCRLDRGDKNRKMIEICPKLYRGKAKH